MVMMKQVNVAARHMLTSPATSRVMAPFSIRKTTQRVAQRD